MHVYKHRVMLILYVNSIFIHRELQGHICHQLHSHMGIKLQRWSVPAGPKHLCHIPSLILAFQLAVGSICRIVIKEAQHSQPAALTFHSRVL